MIKSAKIQRWGNSLAIRISGDMKDIPNFKDGDVVSVNVLKSGLIVEKQKESILTEELLLKNLTSFNSHADEIANLTQEEFCY